MILREWAVKWKVPPEAIHDLESQMGVWGLDSVLPVDTEQTGEANVQQEYRFESARRGELLYRNNVGALIDVRGVPVRYGLCNDTAKINSQFKSCDLIGIKPLLIEPRHIGTIVGQFKGREMKKPGWHYTGSPREEAQLRFIELVMSKGGDAAFTTGPDWD